MRYALLGMAAVASLYCLHHIALWAERRGWIYYRKKHGSSGTLSNAVLEVHSLFDPSKRYSAGGEEARSAGGRRQRRSPDQQRWVSNRGPAITDYLYGQKQDQAHRR
jgi:hypothetical protein